jgi:hypothetical protein
MRLQRFGGAKAVIALALSQQPVRVIDVRLHALGLTVRPVVAPGVDAFVPLQPHPAQVVQDRLLGFAGRSLEIGVLDAQDEGALLAARQQPVEQCRPGVADVQMAGGRRGETDAHQ